MRLKHTTIWLALLSVCIGSAALAECRSSNNPRVSHLLQKASYIQGTKGAQAAAEMLGSSLQTDTTLTDYRLFVRLAELHRENTRNFKARAAYEAALELCGELAWLWQKYGALCWDMKEYRCAAEAFLNACERGGGTSTCYDGIVALSYAGQAGVAVQKLQSLIEQEEQAPIHWVEAYAQIALQGKKVPSAIDALRIWEQRYQKHFGYWRARAYLHIENTEYLEAVACLRVANTIKPLALQERSTLAELLLQVDLPQQAAQQYVYLLRQDENQPQWHQQLIVSYVLATLPDKALAALEQGRDIIPQEFYLRQKGELHYQQENYAAAFDSFAKLLALEPDDSRIHLLQGHCALQLGKKNSARHHLKEALTTPQYRKDAQSLLEWMEQRRSETGTTGAN